MSPGWRTAVVVTGAATVVAGSSAGAASWAAHNYLMGQAAQARGTIGRPSGKPPRRDGVYCSGGPGYQPWHPGVDYDLHLMVFGDSTAAGIGANTPDEVVGVRIARGLAEESGKRIRLSTKAISGATSKGLAGQVDAMFIAGPAPDAAVILVGANDVIKKHSVSASAHRLGDAVGRLTRAGAVVVVGTCPDLGVIAAIPQPLRTVVRRWGLQLARAQAAATRAAGGVAVPLADLLAREFLAAPETMLSADRFHPSAAGYELAAGQLTPALAEALGEWQGGPVPTPPERSVSADRRRLTSRALAATNRFLRRHDRAAPVQQLLDAADTGPHRSGTARTI
ncbi:MAG TPA: SGNH/GDSL hydrolase family protein [Aldersonia sp.]